MTRIRLLPLVLIAISALLAVKLLGFITGTGSFAVGPRPAIAEGGGHGESAAPAAPVDNTAELLKPVDLATELEALKAEQAAAAAKEGGHGGGEGHGEAAPAAEGGHGEAAPAAADAGHGEAAPAAAGHGDAAHGEAAPATDAAHGEAAPAADAAHGEAAPAAADAGHGEAKPAEAGHGEAKAAEGGHGDAKAAEGGHGGGKPAGPVAYTDRPPEYTPPANSAEGAILRSLSERRADLDKREEEFQLRMKLLRAAEERLNARFDQLKSIETQLGGGAPGAGGAAEGTAAPGGAGVAPGEATADIKSLVSLYESMKPKAAAAVFASISMPVLLEITRQMSPRKLSPILAAMPPDKAGLLTTAMAGAQSQPKVLVQTELVPEGLSPLAPVPQPAGAADPAALPQIMPAAAGTTP